MTKYIFKPIGIILLGGFSLCSSFHAEAARSQINIQQIATTTCAVMAGQQKLDRRSLQYLSLLDEDLADPNPIAIALYREVIRKCPNTYLDFHRRKIAKNPFPPGYLVNPKPIQLINPNR